MSSLVERRIFTLESVLGTNSIIKYSQIPAKNSAIFETEDYWKLQDGE